MQSKHKKHLELSLKCLPRNQLKYLFSASLFSQVTQGFVSTLGVCFETVSSKKLIQILSAGNSKKSISLINFKGGMKLERGPIGWRGGRTDSAGRLRQFLFGYLGLKSSFIAN